jgi:hypothetical protein
VSLQRAQRQTPPSTELSPVRSVRFEFIDQALDFFPAAPLPITTGLVFLLHETT